MTPIVIVISSSKTEWMIEILFITEYIKKYVLHITSQQNGNHSSAMYHYMKPAQFPKNYCTRSSLTEESLRSVGLSVILIPSTDETLLFIVSSSEKIPQQSSATISNVSQWRFLFKSNPNLSWLFLCLLHHSRIKWGLMTVFHIWLIGIFLRQKVS